MTTISRRSTRIIGERRLQETAIKGRFSKNGYTTPYEIYGSQDVINTLSDPGHWEKKSCITMCTKKFLLPADYGANDENSLKLGVRHEECMRDGGQKKRKKRRELL